MSKLQRVTRLVAEEWECLYDTCRDELLKLFTVNPPITDSVQTPICLIAVMLWTKNIIQFVHCHLRLHSQHFQYHLARHLGVGKWSALLQVSVRGSFVSTDPLISTCSNTIYLIYQRIIRFKFSTAVPPW